MKQSMVVINKAGGAGGEGFLDVKGSRGNPHKIVITLSNLFTTPLATGIPFNWKDLTPVAMLALDEFVLWVNAETPYKTGQGLHRGREESRPASSRWAAPAPSRKTRSSRSRSRRRPAPSSPTSRSSGGGEVAVQLVGKHVDSTVNNPIEAVAQWRAVRLRPLCVFDGKQLPYTDKVADGQSWSDISDLQVAGPRRRVPDAARHLHDAGRRPPDQVDYYVDLLKKVRETPEWKTLMNERRVQPDLHDRRRVRQVGRQGREAPPATS